MVINEKVKLGPIIIHINPMIQLKLLIEKHQPHSNRYIMQPV